MENLITAPLPWMLCLTCNKNIGDVDFREKYNKLIVEGLTPEQAFSEIGLERECCRSRFTNIPVIATCRPRLLKAKENNFVISTKRKNSTSLPGILNNINEETVSVKTQLVKNQTSMFEKSVPSIEIVKSMRSKK